jgi:hypothetical protein
VTLTIEVPVVEEWNHMFRPSECYPFVRRPFQRSSGMADFVSYSESYSELCGEPIWIYSWGNARWLRCPIGLSGDRLNDVGDWISDVDVTLVDEAWTFVVTVEEVRQRIACPRSTRGRRVVGAAP